MEGGHLNEIIDSRYINLDTEHFFQGYAEKFDKPLKQGDVIEYIFHLIIQ